jgi:CheY-like chemotaxis protein
LARKILLADDSVTAQNMGRKILADAGYEVITVNNGSAALKRIAELRPDLIVLDVYMPGYSGLEVCQRLKETGETARIPVLLTVGKLEPFKPEEAKRARADAFIVKPFEASELLSALTKLEDKIVPRAETSKPGRFARSIAAIEEGRHERTAAAEEEPGWKSRISFPSRKKKAAEQENADDQAIYNPVNKDLRTVVDPPKRPQEAKNEGAKPEDTRVDLAALAPQGLPKDVTPEEIAALAAAAAQIQSSAGGSKKAATSPEPPTAQPEAQTDSKPEAKEKPEEAAPAISAIATQTEAKTEEAAKVSDENISKGQDSRSGEKIEAPSLTLSDAAKRDGAKEDPARESAVPAASSPADALPAMAGADLSTAAAVVNAGNGAAQHGVSERIADEPVTMAVASADTGGSAAQWSSSWTSSRSASSRWTAVTVALAPEEAALSLEQEMQKAQAAFAAADFARTAPVAASLELKAAVEESKHEDRLPAGTAIPAAAEPAAPLAVGAAEAAVAASASAAPDAAQTLEMVTSAATEAIRAAIDQIEPGHPETGHLETQHLEPQHIEPQHLKSEHSEAREHEPASAAYSEPSAALTAPTSAEATGPSTDDAASHPTPQETYPAGAKAEENLPTAREQSTAKHEDAYPVVNQHDVNQNDKLNDEQNDKQNEESLPVAAVADAAAEESAHKASEDRAIVAPVLSHEVPTDETSASQVHDMAEAAPAVHRAHGGLEQMAKKDSDIAETTAAAWASWRKIRESGDAKGAGDAEESSKTESQPSNDVAAMAVAAGAEKAPEEVAASSASDPEGIASIVDSVLADLRPKIVEEISRKLGKKK